MSTSATSQFPEVEDFDELDYNEVTTASEIKKSPDKMIEILNKWFPHLVKFNGKFVPFLLAKGVKEDDLQRVLNENHFVTSTKRYLKEFASLHKNDYLVGLHEQIENIFTSYYQFDSETVEDLMKNIIASDFIIASDYFYDKYVIKTKLDPVISQYQRQSSFSNSKKQVQPVVKKEMRHEQKVRAIMDPQQARSLANKPRTNFASLFIEFLKSKNIESHVMAKITKNFPNIPQVYFTEFTAKYPKTVRNGIFMQIRKFLGEDYSNRQHLIINELEKGKTVDESFEADLVFDKLKLKRRLKLIIEEIVEALELKAAFESLESNLNAWTNNSFGRNFVQFLKTKNVALSSVQHLSQSKELFFSSYNKFLSQFSTEESRYNDQKLTKSFHQKLSQELSTQFNEFTTEMLFNQEDLSQLITMKIEDYKKSSENLQNRLTDWFPHVKNFSGNFIKFLKSKNVDLDTIHEYSTTKLRFMSKARQLLQVYSAREKIDLFEHVYQESHNVLEAEYSSCPRKVVVDMKLLSNQTNEKTFTSEMLVDDTKLLNLMVSVLRTNCKVVEENSLKSIETTVQQQQHAEDEEFEGYD